MISRRDFLRLNAGLLLSAGVGGYSIILEPNFILDIVRYRVTPKNWPADLRLRIAIITDLHAADPWMPAARISKIVELTNALQPDLVALLGDFSAGTLLVSGPVTPQQWGEALADLRAPLGVHAVLGNHDIWHGPLVSDRRDDGEGARRALRQLGARLYENDAARLEKNGQPFWLLGLGDQVAEYHGPKIGWKGHDNLDATLAKLTDDAPAILLAHEPYIFPRVPPRVALTLSGHTHGGQVNLPLLGPIFAQARWRAMKLPGANEYVYGHIVEGDRHLVVSGGLGVSIAPVRFMRPPEIVEVTVESPDLA